MTYIVGLSHHGINSIISDLRVTSGNNRGRNTALKTGILFPGCIFGSTGDVECIRDFVLAAKYSIGISGSIEELRGKFIDYVDFYKFPTGNDYIFQLLLSTRALMSPQFFILDSVNGLKPTNEELITLGSGKEILDVLVLKEYKNKLHEFDNVFSKADEPIYQKEVTPYLMSYWLTQLSQGHHEKFLKENGVGGVFHFISQNEKEEKRQKESLYLVCKVDTRKKKIHFSQYRVSFFQNWLVLNVTDRLRHPPYYDCRQKDYAILDETALPPAPKGTVTAQAFA